MLNIFLGPHGGLYQVGMFSGGIVVYIPSGFFS